MEFVAKDGRLPIFDLMAAGEYRKALGLHAVQRPAVGPTYLQAAILDVGQVDGVVHVMNLVEIPPFDPAQRTKDARWRRRRRREADARCLRGGGLPSGP